MPIKRQDEPILVSIVKVWDHAGHNALTDLIRFHDTWFICCRESNKHVHGDNGIIRILTSPDGIIWTPLSTSIALDGVDLRDPKLSITPDGRLMLLVGGSVYSEKKYITKQTYVVFSSDGVGWGPLIPILQPHDWLWRITWHQGKAYGAAYYFTDRKKEWAVSLYESSDGIHYYKICDWDIPGFPNETTIQFTEDGVMIALVRRDNPHDDHAWIGFSKPPYAHWHWNVTKTYFGGPNFLILPSKHMLAAGRIISDNPYGTMEKTVLARMSLDHIYPLLVLPSGGDSSYPGMVYYNNYLWLSYYSSHEGKAAIYFAKVQVD